MERIGIAVLMAVVISSCVSKKEFAKLESLKDEIATEVDRLESDLNECNDLVAGLKADIAAKDQSISYKDAALRDCNARVEELKAENKEYFNRIGELVNNKDVATEKFMEMIANKDEQLQEARELANKLNYKIRVKDSINLALVLNLKKSLDNINDEDIDVEVRGEKVFVSIADKLLFKSGSSVISSRASEILGKVARILKDNDNIEVMVEGHTDNKPINTSCVEDNWDLSVDRSTAIVRVLQDDYEVDPSLLTAAGRSYYVPKADNDTPEGRSVNRRTEIIITPRLDQYMELHQIDEKDFEGGAGDGGSEDGK